MTDKIIYEERYASHPKDVSSYSTEKLREEFLVEQIFEADKIRLTYSLYDRFILGGVAPVNEMLQLDTIPPLKSKNFCDRREIGVINIGGPGVVSVDGEEISLDNKEALYIGKGIKIIIFKSKDKKNPALFYMNSTPAHQSFPTKKISLKEAVILELGTAKEANERRIIKYIVEQTVATCQLQMGITELKPGSVWNSIPPHTHNRRMEVYFYTNLPENQAICHFMGQGTDTRHIWLSNNQAVISPSWSIHCGVGTSNYIFIWGMAGENLDFTDMDVISVKDLR
ncbi:MAG: 5-dehydro-4-deoxy-D-glucuronate isomerase [Acidobacterium ailaaui]|nr:5-dehydro-4-deoxy-D-glucuronate isomerase [Pseudacidobacterium ailaaui]